METLGIILNIGIIVADIAVIVVILKNWKK